MGQSERMSDMSFKLMNLTFNVIDVFYPHVDKRVQSFGIQPGMTVVDYGCGPGRYTTRFAKLVGKTGKVYAVDIHELAIATVNGKIGQYQLHNVVTMLANGYDSGVPDHVADVVCAIDMFFGIKQPTEFLAELKRIAKQEGLLIIDDGHQSRQATRQKILDSGLWSIVEETRDHLRCKPA
jgi:ubiquinone/menaquinone biosynthesis C-methylase UbiE